MACAIRLLQLLADDEELTERLGEVPVAVIEKGRVAGAHQLSGGVMNPSAIRELLPGRRLVAALRRGQARDGLLLPNRKRAVPLKPTPPPFRNHGNYVVSVAELNRWLGEKAEEMGAYVLSETTGNKLLVEDGKVVGVRTGDKGRDKSGGEKGNFEPGSRRHGQGHRARRGLLGPPHRRRAEGAGPRRQGPAGVGPGREGGLGGRAAVREDRPHARLAAALGREVAGVRRLLDLRHEPRGRDAEGLDRVRHRPRLDRRALLGPRRAAGVQAPPARARRSSKAASASPGARRRSPRAATGRCPRCTRPAWSSPATPAAWSTSPSSRASTTRSSPAGWPRRRSTRSSRTARPTSPPTRTRSTSPRWARSSTSRAT